MSKAEALHTIKELIADFELNKDYFLSKEFTENHCEERFIKPFLKALGWDIESKGIAPYLREVITQDRVKTGKTKKAPDYGFRLPGSEKRLFYIEAKAPSIKLKSDKEAAFQLRRYGRSGQTPVSILFNFSELAVYDCTKRQSASDSASFARNIYLTYEQYADNFDFIYNTFSREAVYSGSFQKYAQNDTQKKGNVTLDKDFVESLNKWRLKLAQSIAKNNFKYTDEEINHAVQLLLDRIIFLRFCEERDVEPFGQLQSVAVSAKVYKHLFDLFYDADKKYNSGLFHFQDGCITEKIKVDDKALKDVIEDLYPPKTDFAFNLVPVEILGNAYEQFLGKTIRITAGHNVKIEEKPEVRKAGGVYYTPQYIVDYIVENTVGKLIEGKSPKEIEKIKIVDPACGSGSFLLGAYKYLLNYHQQYYFRKLPKGKELNEDGTLITEIKKRILTNNIFGVDLDENAVEVSKLSLLLKCMEGETASSVKQQITMYHTRVLPDLDNNIVNGNSLIGYDFFEGELNLDKEQRKELEHKIKPFDWKVTFPQVFKQGGFDAVIGNPPYFRIEAERPESSYLRTKFHTPEFKLDIFTLFIEKFITDGFKKLGFIIPNTLLNNITDKKLRKLLLEQSNISEIVNYKKRIFEDAVVHTMILLLDNNLKSRKITIKEVSSEKTEKFTIEKRKFLENDNYSFDIGLLGTDAELFKKLKIHSVALQSICEVKQAIKTGDDSKYISDKKLKSNYKPILGGKEMNRYITKFSNRYVDYGAHLACARNPKIFEVPEKIIIRETGKKITATLDNKKYYLMSSLYSVYLRPDTHYDIKYLLGVINSKVSQFFMQKLCFDNSSGAFIKARIFHYQQLPIKSIDNEQTKERKVQQNISKIVDTILNFNIDLQKAKESNEIESIKKQITYNENKIDDLVYELYELTPEEIAVIENSNAGN